MPEPDQETRTPDTKRGPEQALPDSPGALERSRRPGLEGLGLDEQLRLLRPPGSGYDEGRQRLMPPTGPNGIPYGMASCLEGHSHRPRVPSAYFAADRERARLPFFALEPLPTQAAEKADESIDSRMPEGIALSALHFRASLPAGKALSRSSTVDVFTGEEEGYSTCGLSATLDREALTVRFRPALRVDPLLFGDLALSRIALEFGAQGRVPGSVGMPVIEVTARDDDSFYEPRATRIADPQAEVRALIYEKLSGTAIMAGGYDPFADPDPFGTIDDIVMTLRSRSGEDSGSEVGTGDLENLSLGATLVLRDGFDAVEDGQGLTLMPGASVEVSVRTRGPVTGLSAADLEIESVSLWTRGLYAVSGGEKVMSIGNVTLSHGGGVSIGRTEPLGKLRAAASVESLLRVAAGGGPTSDVFVGRSRIQIAEAIEPALAELLAKHPTPIEALPELNLQRALGMGE